MFAYHANGNVKPAFGGAKHLHSLSRSTIAWLLLIAGVSRSTSPTCFFQSENYPHHNTPRILSLFARKSCAASCCRSCRIGVPRVRCLGWLADRRRTKLLPLCRVLPPSNPVAADRMPVLERLSAPRRRETEWQECILEGSYTMSRPGSWRLRWRPIRNPVSDLQLIAFHPTINRARRVEYLEAFQAGEVYQLGRRQLIEGGPRTTCCGGVGLLVWGESRVRRPSSWGERYTFMLMAKYSLSGMAYSLTPSENMPLTPADA
jgi:hypothetical protein